jgi:hypothetical protein
MRSRVGEGFRIHILPLNLEVLLTRVVRRLYKSRHPKSLRLHILT